MDVHHALITEPVGVNLTAVVLREMKEFARFQIKKPAATARIRTRVDHRHGMCRMAAVAD